jgi:TatD DNase family protein
MLIDSHCHLNHEQLRGEVSEVISRAYEAGVERMIVVGYDLPSSEEAVKLAVHHEEVFAAVAIHPHDSKDYTEAAESRLRELASNPKVVALGEVGLDYHYDFSPRQAQFHAFRRQLALAEELQLPVIIHCREAYGDVIDVLEEWVSSDDERNRKSKIKSRKSGAMHCWAGTLEEADRTVALGLYLGFGGVLTFKNAEENRQIAAAVPLDRILLETDAPYLAPVPHRGKRNEPAYTRLVAQKLAEVRGDTIETIAVATAANCQRLFKI